MHNYFIGFASFYGKYYTNEAQKEEETKIVQKMPKSNIKLKSVLKIPPKNAK